MGILEEVNYMKNHGMNEQEISNKLQEKGITPNEIDNAFNQARIKKAVSAEEDEMERSIVNNESLERELPIPSQNFYTPKTQEINNHESMYAPQPQEMTAPYYEEYSQEEYAPQQGYGEAEAGIYDTDTILEIAEQVFSEKIKKEQKQIESLNEFATLAQTQTSNNHDRLKRIESVMDKLQIAILEKVGSYGKNLETIKKEMEMMEDSFSKILPALHEKHNEPAHHAEHHETSKKKTAHKS